MELSLNAESLKDPLLEYIMPPANSVDRVNFQSNGIYVQQLADVPGKPANGNGLKFEANAKGDFQFELDLKCVKLERPTSGWGQGMMVRVMTDDPNMPVVGIGLIANTQHAKCCFAETKSADGKTPKYFVEPTNFTEGTWIIKRRKNLFSLSVKPLNKSEVSMFEFVATGANLNGIQVWFTRQESGNTQAEFVLKKIRFRADNFFTYQAPPPAYWTWWKIMFGVLASVWLIAASLWWRQRNN